MRIRTGRTALVAGIIVGTIALGERAGAQTSPAATHDSTPRFALFGSSVRSTDFVWGPGRELGGSGDFRWGPIPVPLRLAVAFTDVGGRTPDEHFSQGTASLELVMRPLPTMFGMRPYFLGGLGVATSAGFHGYIPEFVFGPNSGTQIGYHQVDRERANWMFLSTGAGVDVGRFFLQARVNHPVASTGPITTPVSVGFRFWD